MAVKNPTGQVNAYCKQEDCSAFANKRCSKCFKYTCTGCMSEAKPGVCINCVYEEPR